ncbi:MAG TPA: hypothetical protein PKD85_22255, partial [Saprospiraceae bacterium]|nr:hypothetical protein [Saprospiraceae bacterium]
AYKYGIDKNKVKALQNGRVKVLGKIYAINKVFLPALLEEVHMIELTGPGHIFLNNIERIDTLKFDYGVNSQHPYRQVKGPKLKVAGHINGNCDELDFPELITGDIHALSLLTRFNLPKFRSGNCVLRMKKSKDRLPNPKSMPIFDLPEYTEGSLTTNAETVELKKFKKGKLLIDGKVTLVEALELEEGDVRIEYADKVVLSSHRKGSISILRAREIHFNSMEQFIGSLAITSSDFVSAPNIHTIECEGALNLSGVADINASFPELKKVANGEKSTVILRPNQQNQLSHLLEGTTDVVFAEKYIGDSTLDNAPIISKVFIEMSQDEIVPCGLSGAFAVQMWMLADARIDDKGKRVKMNTVTTAKSTELRERSYRIDFKDKVELCHTRGGPADPSKEI